MNLHYQKVQCRLLQWQQETLHRPSLVVLLFLASTLLAYHQPGLINPQVETRDHLVHLEPQPKEQLLRECQWAQDSVHPKLEKLVRKDLQYQQQVELVKEISLEHHLEAREVLEAGLVVVDVSIKLLVVS